MRIRIRPQARAEALEAQAWYESRSVGLGLEFARALEAAVASAVRNPDAFAIVVSDCRRRLLRRFPFSLIYRVRGDEFLIVAVLHHRRHPATVATRTDE